MTEIRTRNSWNKYAGETAEFTKKRKAFRAKTKLQKAARKKGRKR